MSDLHFEWDQRKAAANLLKHKVAFGEAQTAFSDEHGILIDQVIRIISARKADRFERRQYEEGRKP